MLVVCNFYEPEVSFELPEEFAGGTCLISNYPEVSLKAEMTLRPYEAFVIKK